ncbi:hypothetical protein HXX76_010070 [Chlamydomonas incerta]|uniref:Uncharacterized protein n=1 Tax=Chlamydomonas incerta TaxID=51695 RepID=A0A835T2V1_CHLIN|nr:hypothetical protein HXX76_010070 [Chlamydomonas incerta]|eukprot:KAG2430551.1 hypothetical protein HXX76_010070 [Chlamydomonas incerta]
MSKRVRDSAGIQSEIDKVTIEINNAGAQVEQANAAVEQARQARNAVSATLRDIAEKLQHPDLSKHERAKLVAKQQLCASDLDQLSKDVDHLRKKEEQLRKKEEQLRKKEEQLRDEKLQEGGASPDGMRRTTLPNLSS